MNSFISSLTLACFSRFQIASMARRRASGDITGPASASNFSSISLSVSGFREGHAVEYFSLPARSLLNRCTGVRMPFAWTINPYRGCEFACKYCYARYTHEFMELRDGLDFGVGIEETPTQVMGKVAAHSALTGSHEADQENGVAGKTGELRRRLFRPHTYASLGFRGFARTLLQVSF